MAEQQAPEFMIEGARLIFRNFAGAETRYNAKGERNFCVVLDPDTAQGLELAGWNVRVLEPREEGDEPTPYIQVKVSFKNKPPRIVVLTSTGRTHLSEDRVEMLDYAELENVDLIARGFVWEVNGKVGTKAYLQSMFVTLREDALERKYAQDPTD
jgi:hypothetical protein